MYPESERIKGVYPESERIKVVYPQSEQIKGVYPQSDRLCGNQKISGQLSRKTLSEFILLAIFSIFVHVNWIFRLKNVCLLLSFAVSTAN